MTAMTDDHKAAVVGRLLFNKAWGQLSKKQQTEARETLDRINAAPKEPKPEPEPAK